MGHDGWLCFLLPGSRSEEIGIGLIIFAALTEPDSRLKLEWTLASFSKGPNIQISTFGGFIVSHYITTELPISGQIRLGDSLCCVRSWGS